MKAIHLPRTIIILCLILIISCNAEKETSDAAKESPRIKKHSKLVSPKVNEDFVLGDTVDFIIESALTVDSILLDYDGEVTVYTEKRFAWIAKNTRTGHQKLRLSVFAEGQSEAHYPKIRFFSDVEPEAYTYEVVSTLPHSETAYTQGLFFMDDTLMESTGRPRMSTLSKVNLATGEPYQSVSLPGQHFGEGSTYWQDKIIQLTWTSQEGFVYNRNLEQTDNFHYSHEGWGITTLGDTLVVSDGTEVLHLLDPRDFSEIGRLEVYDEQKKIINLNELEIIDGLIYANVWLDDLIVVIDPTSGKVLRSINMSGLMELFESEEADTFNGIAYKPSTGQVFVTGKLWPKLFEVVFVPSK